MSASEKIFSLEGQGLKLDTAADLEPHIAPLRAMKDVKEVRMLGNSLGVGACQLLGRVLATKQSLEVQKSRDSMVLILPLIRSSLYTGRHSGRHLHRSPT